MILQLAEPIEVLTPLGRGWTILVIDYGPHINSCWVVALTDDGQVKHFDSNDIKLWINHTLGIAHKSK